MPLRTLGLDLGITSIGWALISEYAHETELEAWGSRIFEAGMDDDIEKGQGTSRCAERRLKRALRIQYRRRRNRREKLTGILQAHHLLPEKLTPEFFISIDNRLLMLFPPDQRRQTAHVLPYLYRKKALDSKLEPEELGRAIYHLAQRRGYKSNRKQDLKDEENSGVVKAGIAKLQEEMQKAGARTLGEYFCTIDPEESRIRTRYTDRSMYEDEFRKICAAQRDLIDEELEKELFNAIFFQRKLKSCKNLIGECRVEAGEKRCSFAREEAQLFRIYSTVNHLRVANKTNTRSLTPEERKKVIEILNSYSSQLNRKGRITLAKLGKALPLGKGEKFTLSDEEKEICGNELHAILYRVFGDRAAELTDKEREAFFQDINSIENDQVLRKRLAGHWKLDAEQVAEAVNTVLPDDYCAFSLKALRRLLPDLEEGIPLNTVLLHLYPEQYHHRNTPLDLLPQVDSCGLDLRNPVVHRTLTELRRVVNAIIKRYGKPDMIHIELARDLKNSNAERKKITENNRKREKERAAIAARIVQEAGIQKPSNTDILKVMLADECDFCCPYTGKHFGMKELLYGKDIHIEHIIPYSRCFDDSFANKTLCDASANSNKKGNSTPYEAFSGAEYEEILQRVKHFKGDFAEAKLDRFLMKEVKTDDFLARNLNDTRYASKLAVQYLSLLYGGIVDASGKRRIQASSGSCTAMVRRIWGGNYLLGEGEKVRTDHRHHAIDALTIALTTPEIVKRAANTSAEERKKLRDEKRPLLGDFIYSRAREMLDQAAVSHHVKNKIRGAFHKETIYSQDYGNTERHVRTALSALTAKDLPRIVDKKVRRLILDKLGVTEEEMNTVKDPALRIFKEEANLPWLTDKNGNPVNQIRCVRVKQSVATRTIGEGDRKREVANGANHLLAIFAELDENGQEKGWTGEVVTLLDARLRLRRGEPLFAKERPGMKFKFTLKKGDIVSWMKDGKEQLCVIRGISLREITCVPINAAGCKDDLKKAKQWFRPSPTAAFKGGMKKYQMNIFGELRRAND